MQFKQKIIKQIISLSIVLNAFDTAEMRRMNRALFIKHPNERNESIYKTYRNKFKKIKKAAKNIIIIKHKGNLRYSWKLIKEVINKYKVKMELSDYFKENETIISDPVEISNKFNEYFINVDQN